MVATLLRGLFKPNSFVKNTSLFLFLFLSISFFSGFISEAHAQDALIKNKGQQSICFGERLDRYRIRQQQFHCNGYEAWSYQENIS